MGSLSLALESARSGLLVNQAALSVVASNIANVNAPGYSRKLANQTTRIVNGEGAGVQLSGLSRNVDQGLLRSLRIELAITSELRTKDSFFGRLQELFGSPAHNSSISHLFSNFAGALEALAVSPEKTLDQTEVVRRAQDLTIRLQSMSQNIQELRRQADYALFERVIEINELTKSIADLNKKVIRNDAVNLDVTDLQDQRDLALDRLAELVDIRYFTRKDGDLVVFTSSGTTLVDSVPITLTHVPASSVSSTVTHAEGDFGGIYIGAAIPNNDITNAILRGDLKGFIDIRDTILPNLQSQLDEMAAQVRDAFNQIHNRGLSFPGGQDFTGTRTFVRPSVQTITLDAASGIDDVSIVLMDDAGNQKAVTTLETIMTSAAYGTGAQAANGPWTLTEVAASVEDWLQGNGAATAAVAIDSAGKFTINLNNSTLSLSFRDQETSTNGSTAADAAIGFDADGDGTIDETVSGFANFLGLNDFFVSGLTDNIYESDVLATTFTGTAATITFTDSSGSLGSVAIAANSTLTEMASAINLAAIGVTATVVPDGAGKRLRIAHDSGKDMTVTQAAADTLLTTMGMDVSSVRVSTNLKVRADFVSTPSKISRGTVQWNASLGVAGKYFTSTGDDTVAREMAKIFSQAKTFKTAGGMSSISVTFEQYSAAIVAQNSSAAGANDRNLTFQTILTENLQAKSGNIRGVNLDEELAQLILLEQAYSASARVITVIQKLFDILDQAVR